MNVSDCIVLFQLFSNSNSIIEFEQNQIRLSNSNLIFANSIIEFEQNQIRLSNLNSIIELKTINETPGLILSARALGQ